MKNLQDFKTKNNRNNSTNLVGKIKVKFLIIVSVIITTLVFTQLVFAGNLAIGGQKLSHIEEEIKSLEAQNTTLRVEISKKSSLSSLSKRAEKLGFEKPSEVIIL